MVAAFPYLIVVPGLEAAVAAVEEHGDRAGVRGHKIRLSVPVQVGNRKLVWACAGGVVAPHLEATVASIEEDGDEVRVAVVVHRHKVGVAVPVQIGDQNWAGLASGWVVSPGPEAAVAPVEEHG
jgi:hypothetical protein